MGKLIFLAGCDLARFMVYFCGFYLVRFRLSFCAEFRDSDKLLEFFLLLLNIK